MFVNTPQIAMNTLGVSNNKKLLTVSAWSATLNTDWPTIRGAKRPVSLVVVSPSARRAFRVTGEEVSLDQLMQEAPDVKEILERV